MDKKILKLYEIFNESPFVSTDTRSVTQNSIFFALKGDNFNGNEYAEIAIEKGACLAVIDDARFAGNKKYLLVDNVLDTLQNFSLFYRKKFKIPFIGITGSNGKTTTKELINAVLSSQYNCLATKGNLNNHIGVPLTLLSIDKKKEIAIIEMGANHIGEIKQLCNLACPTHGVITNIGKAHLEGFINYNNIVNTKLALYKYIKNKGVCVFVNTDDSLLMDKSKHINRVTYSNAGKGDVNAAIFNNEPFISVKWKDYIIQTNLFGQYNIYNVLAAITIGQYFNISSENIITAINSYVPQNNRSQIVNTSCNTLVMDAYNANPTSMEASINSFAQLKEDNKCAVIGDMLELGNNSVTEHLKIIDLLKQKGLTKVFLVGNIFSSINNTSFKTFKDSESLKNFLSENPLRNNTILIKGSRGIKLEIITQVL